MEASTTPHDKDALRTAAELIGGQASLAALLGLPDRRNVWPWFNTERRIPCEHCPAIERATDGLVTVEELRPDAAWLRVKDKAWPHPMGRPVLDFSLADKTAQA